MFTNKDPIYCKRYASQTYFMKYKLIYLIFGYNFVANRGARKKVQGRTQYG